MAVSIRLGLNPAETEVFNSMTVQETNLFNALPDDNARIAFIQAFVARDRTWREKSNIDDWDKQNWTWSVVLRH
ncbi:hypothetical protein C1645_818945 [Glomus cerebriforme]|uniref:Uncharacterized protein n=1 Tax=Glomus cerebriforme TaxID=658196 RepID=A0A397T675_9GLOM|nr:hypothetical protein C1645_818945 [Glomus cerebriforme]